MPNASRNTLADAFAIVMIGIMLDAALYQAFPFADYIRGDHQHCPAFAAGCAWSESNAAGSVWHMAVRVPVFSIEVHEWLHAHGYTGTEVVPTLVQASILWVLCSISAVVYSKAMLGNVTIVHEVSI